jgi:hypothetical protein
VWRAKAILIAVGLLALSGAGCGAQRGGEADSDTVRILVTERYGTREVAERTIQPAPQDATAERVLDDNLEVERDGDQVTAIEGRATRAGGPGAQWHLYVNGVEADEPADKVEVRGGDRLWWDLHGNRVATNGVPAVVGAFPQPLLSGLDGERVPVRLECASGADAACDVAAEELERAGIPAARSLLGTEFGEEVLRVVVCELEDLPPDPAGRKLVDGPPESGVFARVTPEPGRIDLLDVQGRVTRSLQEGGGLVASVRDGIKPPTLVVTGTDEAGLRTAAAALNGEDLDGAFALATWGAATIPLPTERR